MGIFGAVQCEARARIFGGRQGLETALSVVLRRARALFFPALLSPVIPLRFCSLRFCSLRFLSGLFSPVLFSPVLFSPVILSGFTLRLHSGKIPLARAPFTVYMRRRAGRRRVFEPVTKP